MITHLGFTVINDGELFVISRDGSRKVVLEETRNFVRISGRTAVVIETSTRAEIEVVSPS